MTIQRVSCETFADRRGAIATIFGEIVEKAGDAIGQITHEDSRLITLRHREFLEVLPTRNPHAPELPHKQLQLAAPSVDYDNRLSSVFASGSAPRRLQSLHQRLDFAVARTRCPLGFRRLLVARSDARRIQALQQ
ncbi:hypothetical protein IYW40_00940 [Methylocystis sp. H4A]|uniref:hypothetical protein n=1 Tax=Methylocystis sp. H4A TaxID=2785788 RepID=UPI0018C335BE|nr:hypothetical protein [Methylocystis sp. H4A]MBG0800088.1 hypothetical protein [Methylocystis sp. H4A]